MNKTRPNAKPRNEERCECKLMLSENTIQIEAHTACRYIEIRTITKADIILKPEVINNIRRTRQRWNSSSE
jgi:hypothetical protein